MCVQSIGDQCIGKRMGWMMGGGKRRGMEWGVVEGCGGCGGKEGAMRGGMDEGEEVERKRREGMEGEVMLKE